MSNPYFQFKQFTIAQNRCAMKVTTDACIQGAWTPILPGIKRVLDIGTGTGLLSLMLAQRSPDIIIDAMEADEEAAAQAKENAGQSPWNERINIITSDVRDYKFSHNYDLIISNPPFFTNNLLGPDEKKNAARHTLSLTQEALLEAINKNVAGGGVCSILLPVTEYQNWETLARENHWNEINKLGIAHKPGAQVKRVASLWGKKEPNTLKGQNLVIKDNENNYTPGFKDLLSPFYLHL